MQNKCLRFQGVKSTEVEHLEQTEQKTEMDVCVVEEMAQARRDWREGFELAPLAK